MKIEIDLDRSQMWLESKAKDENGQPLYQMGYEGLKKVVNKVEEKERSDENY